MITPIVFATDDGYSMPTAVAIKSIVNNCSGNELYFFILYKKSLSRISKELINMAIENERIKVHLEFLDVSSVIKTASSHITHISEATYYRIALPLLLSEYNQCLYLDGDIVVTGDICQLCNIELNYTEIVAGVPTVMIQTASHKVQEKRKKLLGIQGFDDYINAGVALMNLKLMREENLVDIMMNMIPKNFPLQDQDILNAVSYKKTKVLPPKYNAMPSLFKNDPRIKRVYTYTEIREATESPVIIHYADKYKPWKFTNIPCREEWYKVYMQMFSKITLDNKRYSFLDKNRDFISKYKARIKLLLQK